jgi:arylsulfatase A-like enzyme
MYYVQPLCTPTRGAIMTGRYPSHTGLGPDVIHQQQPFAMPKREVFVSELLHKAGYATAAVGKWHLGLCDERYTPTFRGFDSFLGFLGGGEDYFSHTMATMASGKTHAKKWQGIDFRNGSGVSVLPPPCNDSHGSSAGHSTGPAAAYSSVVFSEEVARLARHHASSAPASQPLFVYLPFQSVHEPHQAPQSYLDRYHEVHA